jgi:ZIP family zinc transporter
MLGAFAGITVFLGLPIARLERTSRQLQAFLNALATGVLIFLLWDILSKAAEPINAAIDGAKKGDSSTFLLLLGLFVVGIGVGLLGLVYFDRNYVRRGPQIGAASASQLSLMIATGIGLHNFSEGLAIGQAFDVGAVELATVLVIGFALHNFTEGFGIAAPFTSETRPTWGQLLLLGLIAGGPTFLGTVVGYRVQSPAAFVLCLALAAGSILYVVGELLHVGRRFQLPELATWGIFLGLVAGYGTDLVLTWGGL